jgi:hypothetical protein
MKTHERPTMHLLYLVSKEAKWKHSNRAYKCLFLLPLLPFSLILLRNGWRWFVAVLCICSLGCGTTDNEGAVQSRPLIVRFFLNIWTSYSR